MARPLKIETSNFLRSPGDLRARWQGVTSLPRSNMNESEKDNRKRKRELRERHRIEREEEKKIQKIEREKRNYRLRAHSLEPPGCTLYSVVVYPSQRDVGG
eukprot:sb/3478459/